MDLVRFSGVHWLAYAHGEKCQKNDISVAGRTVKKVRPVPVSAHLWEGAPSRNIIANGCKSQTAE